MFSEKNIKQKLKTIVKQEKHFIPSMNIYYQVKLSVS